MSVSRLQPNWLTVQRENFHRVEVLIPVAKYAELDKIATERRIGIGTLIKAALQHADLRALAKLIPPNQRVGRPRLRKP